MFQVPRNAGNHPRLFLAVVALIGLLLIGAVAAIAVTVSAPERLAESTAPAPPPRPPVVVVEALPQLSARLR
ncbi:MAG: serine hydrolase, partial [Caulobacteraceae bacterium]|nr:serine hydrolase [Caulobacteraceae bacterium]